MADLPDLTPSSDNIYWIAYHDMSEFVSNIFTKSGTEEAKTGGEKYKSIEATDLLSD